MNKNNDLGNTPHFPPEMSNGLTMLHLEIHFTTERIDEIVETEHVETTITVGPRATMTKKSSKSTSSSTSFSAGGAGASATAAPASRTSTASPAPTACPKYSLVLIRNLYGQDVACICAHLNQLLAKGTLASGYLPLKEDSVYDKLCDGVLLCAMANALTPGSIDDASVSRGAALEGPEGQMLMTKNISLGLMSLKTMGIYTDLVDAQKIYSLGSLIITGLLLQILRVATLDKFNLKDNEQLVYIFDNWSDKEELIGIKSVTRENMLQQWVNYQLRKGGTDLELKDFSSNLADSVIYTHLLRTIAPEAKKASLKTIEDVMSLKDMVLRATFVVHNASLLGINDVITPEHIAGAKKCGKPSSGPNIQRIYILNLAFIHQIYSRYPNIDVPAKKLDPVISKELKQSYAKGASEETLLMWINSTGPKPPVIYLDSDLCNGKALLQVWESISPGSVNWSKVDDRDTKLPKRKFVWLSNCAEVMECAKKHGIKLNCSASDIATGEKLNTLALVFMMMRLHSQLRRKRTCGKNIGDLTDNGLVQWFNKQIKQYGSTFELKDIGDPGLKSTNALGFLGERVLTESGRGGPAGSKASAAATGGKCRGAGAGGSKPPIAPKPTKSPAAAEGSSSSSIGLLPVKSAAQFGGAGAGGSKPPIAPKPTKSPAAAEGTSSSSSSIGLLPVKSAGGGFGGGGGNKDQTKQKQTNSEEGSKTDGASKKSQSQGGSGGQGSSNRSESESQFNSKSKSQSKSGGSSQQQSGYSKTEYQKFATGSTTSHASSASVTIKSAKTKTTRSTTSSATSISAKIVRNGNSADEEELQSDNATKAWLFNSVEPVAGIKLDIFSSTAITMFRQGGVSVLANKLGPETDSVVYRDILFQLNALCCLE